MTNNYASDYKITASQLNAFDWYLHNEKEDAEQQLLDTINRKDAVYSEAMAKGIAFENIINRCLCDNDLLENIKNNEKIRAEFRGNEQFFNFYFDTKLILKMHNSLELQRVHSHQVYVTKNIKLEKSNKNVELYGIVDYLCPTSVIDLKTTTDYNFPKYITNWQLYVYGYCLSGKVASVDFVVADFTNKKTAYHNEVYQEIYAIEHINYYQYALNNFITLFVEWLENNKEKITDKKIFGGENEVQHKQEYSINLYPMEEE